MDLFPKEERKRESSQTRGMRLEQQGGNRGEKQQAKFGKILKSLTFFGEIDGIRPDLAKNGTSGSTKFGNLLREIQKILQKISVPGRKITFSNYVLLQSLNLANLQ